MKMVEIELMKSISQDVRLLYVEDDAEIRKQLSKYLGKIFRYVDVAAEGQEGLTKFRENSYDLIVTDIQMPYMNGLEMIAEMKTIRSDLEVIIITAFNDTRYMTDAIRLGVNNYILKPIDYTQMNMALYKSLNQIRVRNENAAYKQKLESLVEQRTRQLLDLKENNIAYLEKTIDAIVDRIDGRSAYGAGHSRRVAAYAVMIAGELGYSKAEIRTLERAAMLHDIGKVALPDTILAAEAETLEGDTRDRLCRHVAIGSEILQETPYFGEIDAIIQCHHEHYDGSGYPQGRRGDEIPMLSHILIVANAFDAMTSARAHRMEYPAALRRLQEESGTRFHPKAVTAAVKVLSSLQHGAF